MNVMDVLAPPEVTSTLIHSGPGAGSLIEASGAWQRLAVELENSAAGYASALSSLIESWHGPSAAAMVQAVQPYLVWLHTTAQQAQQLAASTDAAAMAFTAVHSAVVPPSVVAANRTQLAQLLATNRFGQNTAAIAATQDEYQTMWANNSAALSNYQAASAQTTQLPRFASPNAIADPAGTATQAGVVSANTASPAITSAQSLLGAATAFDPNAGWPGFFSTWGNQFISSGFPINLLGVWAQYATAQGVQSVGGEVGQGLAEGEAALAMSQVQFANAIKSVGAASAPTAAMGVGVTVGKLTAPPAIVGLLPASQTPVQLASAASPLAAGEAGMPMPMMPMLVPPPVSAGSGWRKRKQKNEDMDYGVALPKNVIHRPPSGG